MNADSPTPAAAPAPATSRVPKGASVTTWPARARSWCSCPGWAACWPIRFLALALREAGYRVACTDLRGQGGSDATFPSYGDEETADDAAALIGELGRPGYGENRQELAPAE
jgi:pimeloyl-ACP methyl ester carboxylesterase